MSYRLRCFGYPRIESPDSSVSDEIEAHPKPFALLIYLACRSHAQVLQRESILPVFWPESDESHSRNCLRQTLHVLRSSLGAGVLKGRSGGELRLDAGRFTSDVREFLRALEEGRPQDAMAIRSEEFLLGFFVSDASPFMAWVDDMRRSLAEEALDAAIRLARRADANRDLHEAIAWWHRALELAPFDEEVMASLVWALAVSGNRGSAQEVYRRFRERMMDDLEVEPSRTTELTVRRAMTIPGPVSRVPRAPSLRARPRRDAAANLYPNL